MRLHSVATAEINASLFRSNENSANDQFNVDCQPLVKSIACFSQMVRDEKLNSNEVSDVISKLDDFLDQKEFEKEEIIAELQLGYEYQELLEQKRDKLLELMTLKK